MQDIYSVLYLLRTKSEAAELYGTSNARLRVACSVDTIGAMHSAAVSGSLTEAPRSAYMRPSRRAPSRTFRD